MESEEQKNNLSEQQQKIIKYIIKNSPFGEIKDVFNELGKLVDNLDLQSPFIQQLLQQHNEEHLAIAKGENNYQFVMSPISYNDEGYYVDQKQNKKVFIDQIDLKVTKLEDIVLEKNDVFEQYRILIEKGLNDYVSQYYKDTSAGVVIFVRCTEENFTFYIAITCKNLNLKNYHGGEWISEWSIDNQNMKGKIRINSHFFEDGNVALKEIKSFECPFTFQGDIEKESQNFIKQIIQFETETQIALNNIYDGMTDLFFKGMRRILPVTNTKMDWNYNIHKMRGNLSNK